MRNGGRSQNEKLQEIYAKLRDPNGNFEQLRRNAIVTNRHKGASPNPWPSPSRPHVHHPSLPVLAGEPSASRSISIINQ